MNKSIITNNSNFHLYTTTTTSGKIKIEVFVEGETVWLTQKAIADLFGKERSVITKHLKNIFETGELAEKSNVQKMHISGSDKPLSDYNLDVIIAVGYRVNSYQATQFRIWATKILKEFMIKGFVLDDDTFLHNFLELCSYPILKDKGKVSMLEAKLKAENEFEKYRVLQDKNYMSDFDKEVKRILGNDDNQL